MIKKMKRAIKRAVVKTMRRMMRWYRTTDLDNSSQKIKHYRLDGAGKLTTAKKKQILDDIFQRHLGYAINWDDPKTFNEKIMWLKLNYQNPLITQCSDKFSVKFYVDDILGPGHTVPTIDWWTDPDDIDFSRLPDRFALKVNWSSGFNIIVPDKSKIDEGAIRDQLRKWIQPSQNSYFQMFNWGYRHMSPVIYAEEYISEVGDSSQVFDYKFFCYNGVCKNLFITTDRFTKKTYNWFDRDFNELPFTYGKAGKTEGGVQKPPHYEQMIAYAEQLAKPFPFVRVDFYDIGDRVIVGEMTFYSGGGILKFTPPEWDAKLGELIQLPEPMSFDSLRHFDEVSPKQAYLMESRIGIEEKQIYCEQKGFAQLHYWPNLSAPKTYNEKLLWLALHYTNPLVAQCTDKWEMKQYVAKTVGEQYVVPGYGVYSDLNEVDWDALPNQFVVKSTAGWGNKQVKIIKNKQTWNRDVFMASIAEWLYPWNAYYYANMCITDEKVRPRILFEKMLGDGTGDVVDYKFYCSYGQPKFALIVSDRTGATQRRAFVDVNTWEVIPVRRRGVQKASSVPKPERLEELLEVCRTLSADIPWVRLDFYEDAGQLYVGEMTFNPGLFLRYEPVEWDRRLGDMIDLDRIPPENIR